MLGAGIYIVLACVMFRELTVGRPGRLQWGTAVTCTLPGALERTVNKLFETGYTEPPVPGPDLFGEGKGWSRVGWKWEGGKGREQVEQVGVKAHGEGREHRQELGEREEMGHGTQEQDQ